MGMHLYLGKYSAAGLKGLLAEGGSAREQATRDIVKQCGGSVVAYGFLQGDHDFFVLAELADDRMALIPPLMAGSSGTVSVSSTRVYTAADLDWIRDQAQGAVFRPAGH